MPKNKKSKKMSQEERERILSRLVTNVTPKKVEEDKKIDELNIDESLKSPVVSFLGHVDAGKTSLMDIIRGTSIQQGEAGGITQGIGSSFVPIQYIRNITKSIKGKYAVDPNIPGILIVDTPGHSAFSSMRDRGSSLCDIAILVIDLNSGIQPQTEESIKILKEKNVPFVIAATKIDMIYGWKKTEEINLRKVMKQQDESVVLTMQSMMEDLKYELSKLDVAAEFYFQNKTPERVHSIVPISSVTKEGLSDLLSLIVFISQNWMSNKITYKNKLDATVMEALLDTKLGWVLDVIISNGTLNVGDKIVVTTQSGPKISSIRNILIPPHLTQDRHKVSWQSVSTIKASQGIRIIGSNLENSIAGSSIFKISKEHNNEEKVIELANLELEKFWKSFEWDRRGVYLVTPTLGELDAAYNVLKEEKISIIKGEIGNMSKKYIDKYNSLIMEESLKENRVILYFHSKKLSTNEEDELNAICKDNNIVLLHDLVIYSLVKKYNDNKEKFKKERKESSSNEGKVIFPCELMILKNNIFRRGGKQGLLFGVKVMKGKLLKGTPLITKNKVSIGKICSIQKNGKDLTEAGIREEVCISLIPPEKTNITFGRQIKETDELIAEISRESIDELKLNFKDEMEQSDWKMIVDHMGILDIKRVKK